jgi:hypothetical protein
MGPAAPPKPAGIVCPACGAVTDRADARYCLRCGKPFPGMEPAPPPAPARPAAQPPAPPPKSEKGLPQWVLWVAMGFCGLMCLITLLTIAAFTIPRLAGAEPSPTPTVAPTGVPTDVPSQPTVDAMSQTTVSPMETPTESPTATPTPTPPPEPTATSVPQASPAATVILVITPTTVTQDDVITVTVHVTNTGQVLFRSTRCHLVWDGPLEPLEPSDRSAQSIRDIPPQETREVVFRLKAVGSGDVGIQASVTTEASGVIPPLWAAMSERKTFTISE